MAQRYTDPVARERMARGHCPECGGEVAVHTGWGASGCSLTYNGVADRINQYEIDLRVGPPLPGPEEPA